MSLPIDDWAFSYSALRLTTLFLISSVLIRRQLNNKEFSQIASIILIDALNLIILNLL
ncbi:MAG TPA: hypothetical protein PKU83_07980 [Chryseolinea sp.]|nr:hypothetical protein [Chryseolinea sp.]